MQFSAKLTDFLKTCEFLYIATAGGGKPSVAPKFLISVKADSLYLADFVRGGTWKNLQAEPSFSLAVMDYESLAGFQLFGRAQLLSSGAEYDALMRELEAREVSFTAERVLASVEGRKAGGSFEIAFPKDFGIIRARVTDMVRIGFSGKLEKV